MPHCLLLELIHLPTFLLQQTRRIVSRFVPVPQYGRYVSAHVGFPMCLSCSHMLELVASCLLLGREQTVAGEVVIGWASRSPSE